MSAGFNTLSIAHRIDEFVFDCSFDSLVQANALEPEMSTLLTAKLLPVIDAILNEFDEADTVWRLGQVEIDLGDIFSDDFHTELMLRVQEKLREKLLRLQDHHHSLDSVLVKQLPVQRLNKLQTDLEQLQDFLLTGRMPWPIDTADRHAHENMLRQIVQQQDARKAWVMLLKRLTAAQRTIAIGRLVAQFSYRSLENVLTGIASVDAQPLLDFLSIYQHALSAGNSKPAVQAERIRSAWEQLFRMLLESNPLPGNWTILLDRLIKTIVLQHAQESSSMLESIRRTAAQYREEGKISDALHAALQTVNSLYLRHPQHGSTEQLASLKHRSGSHDAVQSGTKETKSSEEKKREMAPETTASPDWRKQTKQTKTAYGDLYVRIGQALQKAGLIDAGFALLLVGLPSIERRQRLRGLLQLPAVKSRLPQLPRAVLLDISYLLSPQAALLIECLLVHAGHLYRLPGSSRKTTQKRWQQQLWVASLDYLLTKTHVEIDPAVYLQALAYGISIEKADPQITLRVWYEVLEHSEPDSVLATLLRICIGSEPEWRRAAVEESAYLAQESLETSAVYRKLQQHLTTGKSSAGQDGLPTLLKTLATDHLEQLQQFYRDLRNGRYDLIAAQLNAIELHGLIEKLLQVQASTVGADWQAFLQAIETQAARVDDQTIYYRWILEDLLQEWEIDLEAIAALARRSRNRIQGDKEEWNEQTEAEEAEGIEETEAARTAEQARSEAAADPVTYPTEQSTRQIRTGYTALYSRITAVLRKVGFIYPEIIATEAPGKLRQHLRAMLRGINVSGQVEKLPQPSRMEIAYLLSPQAALLNEHLLAHADKLRRSTATSAGGSRQQWEQRLWSASLDYLLTETESDIVPAAYLQALARGVSNEADPWVTLRAWYEALNQSKAFGTVHTVLQNFFSGTRERDRASTTLHLSMQPEAVTQTGKLEDAGLPETLPEKAATPGQKKQAKQTEVAYEELYGRVAEALQKAGLIDAGFASMLMELAPVERRQWLRRLLQSPAVKPHLAQLPQAALLDIGYLLSPQAALLNEHLLAHADKLRRSTATSAGGNRQQWEQRLWSASLDHLLTETESDIVPAAYLQALARGVSNEADPWATLRAWYAVLDQSRAFGTVHTVLQNFFSGTQERDRASTTLYLSTQPEAVTQTGKLEDAGLLETSPEKAVTPGQKKQAKQVETAYGELYVRIAEVLQKAGLIDAGFASMLMELVPVERRQRLQRLLQSPAVKTRLAQLPQAALLDISYLLLPPAALLVERLLAHAGRLYRLSRTDEYITRKHWKQQRWSAALDYLLREADSPGAIDLIDFMRALAQGARGKSAKTQITLRAWYEALAHSEPHGVTVTLLRMLIDEAPERNEQAEESVTQSGKLSQENTLRQPLHNHLTTGNATPGQQDLKMLLEALVAGYPEQLRRLYQDLRSDRYDWAALQLNATGLHRLIEKLLQIRSGIAGTDWRVFLQAIEAQADRVDDQVTYYRLILEDLLQEREIDLEAIAVQARQPLGRTQDDEEDRGKQAGAEETKRVGETEGTEIAGQVTPEAVAEPVVYPTGQSTTKPIHIGHAALYLRITAALQKAGLIGEHSAITAMEVRPDELRQRLRAILRGINTNGWVEKLPQASRMDIAYLLSPQAALLNEHVLAHADALQRSTSTSTGSNRQQWQQRLWEVSLNYLLTEIESEITPAVYLQALACGVSNDADPRPTLHAWYEALQQSKASAAMRTLLQTIAEASALLLCMNKENPDSIRLMAGAKGNAIAAQKPPLLDWDALLHRAQSTDDVREEIYIENAGQVLAAPYLPRLFSMLKLVEDGVFIDRHAAERAVHLLQFMVNEQTQSPEYQLTLNKILCGVTTGIPICAEIDISAHEQETIEGLIRGMIQNWQTIGNTSISGLRETFLQRKGKLQLKEDGMWYLTVEPGVFDMLLDSLPWSYSVIKHSWMERAVHVTWR